MLLTHPSTPRDRSYRVVATVISTSQLGESDRIYTLFSRERGKIRVVAKGVRKPTSRLAPGLELFATSDFQLTRGRDLDIVTGAAIMKRPFKEGVSLEVVSYGSHILELANRLTAEHQESADTFDALAGAIGALDAGLEPATVGRKFELDMLAISGFEVDLYHCAVCGEDLVERPNLFSSESGGFVCQECQGGVPGGRSLSVTSQKLLRVIDRQGVGAAIRLQVPASVQAELDGAMREFISSIIERDLSSLRVLKEIRESSGGYESR